MRTKRTDIFGEIFTPPELAQEMLSSLPLNFWKDPTNTIIDNSCGKGVFLDECYKILVQHHQHEHIVKNMLYGCDIQQDNIDATRELTCITHLECADALTFDYWDNKKFSLVVGNPPYNSPKNVNKKGNRCNPLWISFTELAVKELVKENGYLLYVHPPLYRKVGHKLWDSLNEKHFEEIHMFSQEKSSEIFNCGTKTDWYLWKNSRSKFNTSVVDERGNYITLDLTDKNFLPNHSINQVYELFSGKTDVIYDCSYHHYTHKLSEVETEEYCYPCVYLINNKGVEFRWSSYNDKGHFGVSKVIVSMGTGKAILDWEGQYGMCEISFGIPISSKEEGEKLVDYFSTEYFQNILQAIKWKLVQIDYKTFSYFNKKIVLEK
jgi:hypothetical protein